MKRIQVAAVVGLQLWAAVAMARTPIHLLPTRSLTTQRAQAKFSMTRLAETIRYEFDIEKYREVRVQIMPDHLLVYLLVKGKHRVDMAALGVDRDFHVLWKQSHYHLNHQDMIQQPGPRVAAAVCPDSSIEFIAFAPNNDTLEQQVTEEVAQAAEAAHLKTVRLTLSQATRQNYLNYMTCPRLKGNFYDGDANPNVFTTVDGTISSEDVSTVLNGAFRYHVTNIWLACEAYNDPMLTAVEKTAQSQKYAAGVNDLSVGPSDRAGACAMEAGMKGAAMTQAFQDCYKQLDVSSDQWGFGGAGSDYFGK